MKQKQILRFLVLCLLVFACAPSTKLSAQIQKVPITTVHDTICANKLSTYSFLDSSITEPGTYDFQIMATDSTDSVVIRLDLFVWPNRHDTIHLVECANNFPIQYSEQILFNAPGQNTMRYTTDTNGCDIFSHFIIEANPVQQDTIHVNICENEAPYVFGSDTLFTNDTLTHSFSNVYGCDSIITLVLTINPIFEVTDTITDTICSFDLPYIYGDSSFLATGIYDFEIKSSMGCDSAKIHLDLTVTQTPMDTIFKDLCSDKFPFELDSNNVFQEAGTYYIDHDDTLACHGKTILILNSMPAYHDTIRVDICDVDSFYVFADSTFTESTIYTISGTTQLGCDSITTFVFNIHPSYQLYDTTHLQVCRVDLPYIYQDSALTEEGTYEFDIPTVTGCDSLHRTLNFSILENPVDTVTITVCVHDFPYLYKDTLIDTAGTYFLRIAADSIGCDTLRTLTINEAPTYADSAFVTVCANEPYSIGDTILTEPGIYDIMLQSQLGCDSLVTITLHHYPIYHQDTLEFTTCENELPFTYGDSTFTTAGTHEVYFQSEQGCDSVITIQLNINPILYNADTLQQEICANELPYTAFGRELTASGTYTFTTSSQVTGCDSIFYYHLIVHENPVVTIQGNDYLCDGSQSYLTVEPAMTEYDWNTGFQSQMLAITIAGNYTVTVTNEYGCKGTANKQVNRAELPNIQITGNAAICYGDSAVLNVSGGTSYRWENGSTSQQIVVYPTTSTTYKVTGTDNTPCSNESQFSVTVRALPTPSISGNNVICEGESTTFTVSNSNAYVWSTEQQTQGITIQDAGSYSVTVTDQHGCKGSATRELTVNPKPEARISGASHFCWGESSTLKAEPAATSYLWSFNDLSDQTITITEGGNYSVTITNEFGCSNTVQKQIVIDTLPRIIITGSQVICKGESATLTVTGANNYTWDNGSSDSQIIVYPTENTTYRVTGTNSNSCSNKNSFTISVRELPVPAITSNRSAICQGDSAVFTATAGNQTSTCTYLWSNNISSNKITVRDANNYTVTATDPFGCQGTANSNIMVNENPNAIISGVNHFCEGGNTTLKAMPDGCSYIWGNNDLMEQTITISQSGTYTVTVTNNFGCKSVATKEITTDTLPRIVISGNRTICNGDSAEIMVSGANQYHWDNGSTSSRIVVRPTSSTTYRVTGTNSTPCSSENTFTIYVRNLPTASISGNNDICQRDSSVFIATGGTSYIWSTGAQSDRITVKDADTYTVTVTDRYGCSSIANRSLTVNRIPDVRINGSSQFCQGHSTSLTAVGAQSYEWQETGDISQTITINQPGTYTVIGTSDKGCTATASKTITTTQVSNLSFMGSTSFCHGQSTTLGIVGNSDYSYEWNNGLSTSTITITTPGLYSVTITDEHNCQKVLTTTIVENPLPTPTISGNLEICEGYTTKLTASGGQTYLWEGNVHSSSLTVNSSGSYTVTVTNVNGCTATATADVTVYPKPTIQIMSSRDHVCSSTESITLRAIVPNGRSYFWSTGQETQSITVIPGTTNTYNVYVIDDHNCSNTNSTTIQVSPEITPYIIGNTSICQGNSTTLTASSNALVPVYQWSNHQSNSSITVNSTGTYMVTVTDNSGCTGTAQVFVNIHELPTATINDRITICEGDTATLSVQTNENNSIIWRTENGQSTIGNQRTLKVTQPGTYIAVITNSNSCSIVLSTEVVSNPRPRVNITGNTSICQGNSTILTATAESACDFSWSSVHNPSLEVSASGLYTVTATNTYNCSNKASVSVTVHEIPMPVITGTETICPGTSTNLTVSNASSYRWSTGDTTSIINVTPAASSNYTVTVTDEFGCAGTTHHTVNISELPQVSISGRNEFCIGDSTRLTTTPGYTYLWSNNNSTNSITVREAGTYTVTAFNDIGCQNTASITTIVHELPELNFGMQHDICAGNSYTYTLPDDPNLSYHWSNNATGNSITVSTAGVYTVSVTNQYGCTRSASDNLIVHELPTPVINGETSICKGSSTMLSVTGGNRYHWSTGSASNFIVVSPNNETTYSVTAFNEYNCSATAYHTVGVKVLPSVYFSGERNFCEGTSTTITVSGGSSCVWNTGSTSSTININTPGTYAVTVTNLQGCQRSDTISITTRPNPVINVTGNSMICAGNSTTLTATGGSTYQWSTGSNGNSIIVVPEATTNYTVTGYDNYGCSTTVNKTVNIEPLPDVNISGINAICFGDSTTFTATGGNSYTWSNGSHADNITVNNSGVYTVTATSVNGCSSTESIALTIYPTPVATISGPNSICQNTTAQITANGGDFYLWNTGGNSNSITITHGGTYTVTVSNGNNCSSTASISVTELEVPTLYLNGASTICEGSSTTLVAYGNASNYAWSNGQNGQSIEVNPTVSTTYAVTATGSNGCTKKDSIHITIYPVYAINIAGSICEGGTYTQNGFDIPAQNTPGTFTFHRPLQTIHGCDSIITLTLTVKPLPVMQNAIVGPTLVSNHGSYLYNVSETQYANTFEWRVSNSNWSISNGAQNIISLNIQSNGSGILTAKGINECGFREVSLNIYCNVSVDEYVNESNILVYPVPTRQNLNINFNNAVQDIDAIQVYDNIGRLIQTVQVSDQLMQLDCSGYAAGNYVIRFIDKNGKAVDTRKIIVNK